MPVLPPLREINLNSEAQYLDIVYLTTSKALRRRGWEPELFELDELGFTNELSGTDYPIVLHLHGTQEELVGGWLPESRYDMNEPMEPVEAAVVRGELASLAHAGQIWVKEDESVDAQGNRVPGNKLPTREAPAKGKKQITPANLAA